MDDTYTADLQRRIAERNRREVEEFLGPTDAMAEGAGLEAPQAAPKAPSSPVQASSAPSPSQGMGLAQAAGKGLTSALGFDRPGGPIETLIGMLPIKPEHRPPQAGVRALDAPFKAANLTAQTLFGPIGEILKGVGVPPEVVKGIGDALGIGAEMVIPVNAVGLPAKAGESAVTGLGKLAGAVEQGAVKGAKAVGRGAVNANAALGEAGAVGKVVKRPEAMTAGAINSELDKLDKLTSANTEKLIEAGFGHVKFQDLLKMDHPLAQEAASLNARQRELRQEIGLRYGPSAPQRLPKGFGPRVKE